MSFILDALKKSEAERQRQNVPGLLDLPAHTPKPRFPVWGIWLGLLLGVNLLVLVVVLMRSPGPGPASTPAPTPAPSVPTAATGAALPVVAPPAELPGPAAAPPAAASTAAPATAPTAGSTAFSPLDAQPVYAPEIPVTDTVPPASIARGPNPRGATAQPGAPARPPLPPQAQIPPDPTEVVPTLQEVNLSGNHGLPDLHLDIHVFAAKPAERFVFINNRKYREGATLQEGPTVERITREGVILSYQNLRFSIPRL